MVAHVAAGSGESVALPGGVVYGGVDVEAAESATGVRDKPNKKKERTVHLV